MQQGGSQMVTVGAKGISTACSAQSMCTASKAKCKPSPAAKCTPKDCQSLDAFIAQMTAACAANTQAVSQAASVVSATESGIGSNPMLMGAAGLAVGAGAMAAIKNGQSDKKVDARHAAMGSSNPSAALDCNISAVQKAIPSVTLTGKRAVKTSRTMPLAKNSPHAIAIRLRRATASRAFTVKTCPR